MSNIVELADDTLKITRIFDAPRDMVFKAWSDPERIQAWAGCADAESLEADVDFRVGGGYRHVIRIAKASVLTMFGVYKQISVPDRIVYSLEWEPFGSIDPVPPSEVSVEFLDAGEATEVRLTHRGLTTQEMRENVPGGWNASLDRLATTLWSTSRRGPEAAAPY